MRVFISWDQFDHKNSLNFSNMQIYDTRLQLQNLEIFLEDKKIVSRKWSNLNGKVPNIYFIKDIFQNVKRRAFEGNYDDVTIRLSTQLSSSSRRCSLE